MNKDIVKPANKWRRRDFQPIIHGRKNLQELTLGELRALFLTPVGDGLYRRWDIPELRSLRGSGAAPQVDPQYELAIPKWVQRDAEMDDWGALEQEAAISANVEAVWVNL